MQATEQLIEVGHSVVQACRLTGYPRASYYRHCRFRPCHGPARPTIAQKDRFQPAALSDDERGQVLHMLSLTEHQDRSIPQVFYRSLDQGCFVASLASWYRIAREHAMVGDRRRQAKRSSKKIPELLANRPSQVWSWDITRLKRPGRGKYWYLYVIVDIYSRYVVGWALHPYEDGRLAKALIDRAIATNGGGPIYLHSDNGSPMISEPVTTLAELLGVKLSYSRPKVSNDNPYSEALFKTVKYDLSFPEIFNSYHEALTYCQEFFYDYNHHHRHSGIGYNTPYNVHHGQTAQIEAIRQTALDAAYHAHPERFTRRPRPPQLPTEAAINPKPRPQAQPPHESKQLSHTG